jgi:hypothetical protein
LSLVSLFGGKLAAAPLGLLQHYLPQAANSSSFDHLASSVDGISTRSAFDGDGKSTRDVEASLVQALWLAARQVA